MPTATAVKPSVQIGPERAQAIRENGPAAPEAVRRRAAGVRAAGGSITQIKKAYLTFAFAAVTIFALMYGISPTWYAATFLGITDLSPNIAHILRAVTGLYLALAAFWLYSAFNEKYRNAAVLTTILFAVGLAAGRSVSLIVDGQPAPLLLLYGAAELAVVLIGYRVFRLPG